MNGCEQSAYEPPGLDRALMQLISSVIDVTEAGQLPAVWEQVQGAQTNLEAEQRLILNTIVETLHTTLACDSVRLPPFDIFSSPNSQYRLRQVDNDEDFGQSGCFLVDTSGGAEKCVSPIAYKTFLRYASRAL